MQVKMAKVGTAAQGRGGRGAKATRQDLGPASSVDDVKCVASMTARQCCAAPGGVLPGCSNNPGFCARPCARVRRQQVVAMLQQMEKTIESEYNSKVGRAVQRRTVLSRAQPRTGSSERCYCRHARACSSPVLSSRWRSGSRRQRRPSLMLSRRT